MDDSIDDLASIIASWESDCEAWERIIDGLLEPDSMSDVLEKTSKISLETFFSPITI
jgi:hypothetical protein